MPSSTTCSTQTIITTRTIIQLPIIPFMRRIMEFPSPILGLFPLLLLRFSFFIFLIVFFYFFKGYWRMADFNQGSFLWSCANWSHAHQTGVSNIWNFSSNRKGCTDHYQRVGSQDTPRFENCWYV